MELWITPLAAFLGAMVGTVISLVALHWINRPSQELSQSINTIRKERELRENDEGYKAFEEQTRSWLE